MKILGRTSPYHDLYIEGFALLFLVISLSKPFLLIFFLGYVCWQRKQIRWSFFAVLCAILCARYIIFSMYREIKTINDTVKVVEVDDYETIKRLTISYQTHRYHVYTYDDIDVGDFIYISGDVTAYEHETIPYGFDSYQYYLSHNVLGQIQTETLYIVKSGVHFFDIRSMLIQRVSAPYTNMIQSLVFGKEYLDVTSKDILQSVNLLFLMQTTGLHAYILVLGIKKLMFYMNVSEKNQSIIVIIIYTLLCYLNAFKVGVTRLLLSQLFYIANKHYKWRLTPLDRLFVIGFLMIISAFQWVYSTGLLMTFLILITLELARDRYQSHTGYIKRLVVSLLIFGVCLPFTKIITPFVILLLPMFIIYVTGVLYPLALIALINARVQILFGYAYETFIHVIRVLNGKQVVLYLPALNDWQIILYYGFFIYFLWAYKRKHMIISIILMTSLFGYQVIHHRYMNQARVYFLDVGQGDTIFIETRSCYAMIDSFNGSTDFLKNHGINQLDYLFLTHSDQDHVKESQDIIKDIGVDNIVINPYDDAYEKYEKPVIPAFACDQFSCGDLVFRILGPLKAYEDANDNSLVIAVTIESDRYLFLGDISKQVESDLVHQYGHQLKSDIVKIAHHGSNTSTSKILMDYMKPTHTVITVGRNNRFDFPSEETLSILNSYRVMIHRTDIEGTIIITYKNAVKLWETTLSISCHF